MTADDEKPLMIYRGNCHCAAYVFEAKLPEVSKGIPCNCSSCYKRGAICSPTTAQVTFVKGDPATLSTYTFGSKRFKHQFCSSCGSYLICSVTTTSPQGEVTYVNLRVIQDLSVWDLDIVPYDGASRLPAYEPPVFKGEEPGAEIERAKVYTGSCHCGAVTLALKSQPLDETYEEKVIECNCSICSRNAYCWVYPKKNQVTIDGAENLSYYAFGRGIGQKSFCKTCFVPIHNRFEFTDEQLAAMSQEDREWASRGMAMCPVNLRLLEGVDLSSLKVQKVTESVLREPRYVNP
ncbi:Uu.00g008060.m01.CDS01 [Anthostomella pinea]|uniref:Uu.00g008060.m01.CDS01 n=1 Tax=Anthostomella pinea TaxID=933095 RepID=A0AAI8VX44_9PEZI|nr:Uu.00g008060.m01.CDS01 [Anthostomella pinea]